ncbi:MAG: hypothetical protein LBP19_04005 [Treponema sp.]|jgi:hypothetical protein|nr:hypothetical protein [Treponema sp.]
MVKLRKSLKKILMVAVVIFGFLCIEAVFYNRQPVLIVSDHMFNLIYGKQRLFIKRLETQAQLFRPVKQVIIGENTGADLVSLAVQAVTKAPYCVIFPYRYNEGAIYYAKEMPGIPVAVLGRADQKAPDGVIFITTDVETDLYRAGKCAAILARSAADTTNVIEEKDLITVLQRRTLTSEQQQWFLQGTRDEGFTGTFNYFTINNPYRPHEKNAAVVMLGNENGFLEQNETVPVILFSWMDPGSTSSWVKVIFDDSPWSLAIPAIELARKGEGGTLPSQLCLPDGRIALRDLRRQIKEAVE